MSSLNAAIPDALQRELESQRDSLNALFRLRVKQGVKIDPHAFTEHVRNRIGNCIAAIDLVLPERTRGATAELFEVSLELFAAGHFGAETRTPHLSMLWELLFPKIGKLLARAPRQVAGCLSNAVVQIEQQSSTIAERWIHLVLQSSKYTQSVDELLIAGKVAAWAAGMSHYRSSALAASRFVPARVAASLVGLSPDTGEGTVRDCLSQLEASPWCDPTHTKPAKDLSIKQVAVCGAFRGFGGTMMKPPSVATIDNKLMVSDGQNVWQIFADRFGSVTQRVDTEPFQGERGHKKPNPRVTADGTIHWDKSTIARTDLVNATSVAFDGTTLAVTIPTSFHVFLFARVSADAPSSQWDVRP